MTDTVRPSQPFAARLAETCAELSLPCTSAQSSTLLGYLALLQRWNGTYNLTSVRDPAAMFTQHLADCLAVVPAVQRHIGASPELAPRPVRVLDVGSGGGLPGVVLSVLLPQLQVTCVDAVAKKTAFVRQVASELRLPNLNAAHARVESLNTEPFDLVTSRAFASLVDFARLTAPLLAPGGAWMAMKGKPPDDEIKALPSGVGVFHVEPLQVPGMDGQRCLVWMRHVPDQNTASHAVS